MSLGTEHCTAIARGTAALDQSERGHLLDEVPHWHPGAGQSYIEREFTFSNYYDTIAFVNAVAWIAHSEDHHPVLEVSYNRCRVRYHTHSVGGLSRNDFICAAKVDALLPLA